jgi:Holliday junction resolvase-like predicted endonuclease
MAGFFGEFFRVVESNCHTQTGEIDLVLEITRAEPFWAEFGSVVTVECRNRRAKTPRPHIDQFYGAHLRRRTKLAFFVSQAGFSRDAVDMIRTMSWNRDLVLVVPISGKQIVQSLRDREEPDRFFHRIVRHTGLARIG